MFSTLLDDKLPYYRYVVRAAERTIVMLAYTPSVKDVVKEKA